MELNNSAVNITEWILSIGVVVLPTLIVLAASAWLGRSTVTQIRKLWQSVRGGVVSSVDEATDPAIVLLAGLVKRNPADVARIAKRAAQFVVTVFDAALAQLPDEEPPAERNVNIGGAVK